MANRIKGITIEIGGDTTKLDKALSGTNKTISQTQKQLKDVERLLKLDPGNTDLLEQKQRLLAQSVEATAEKLDTLRRAADNADKALQKGKDYQAAYEPLKTELDSVTASMRALEANAENMQQQLSSGRISQSQYDAFASKLNETRQRAEALEQAIKDVNRQFSGRIDQSQYDALQREIIETEHGLDDLQNQASDAERALQGLGNEAWDASDDFRKLNESTENVEDGFTSADAAIGTFVGNSMTKLVDKGLELLDTLWNLDEATEEYRESMGLLSTAYETAGFGAETANSAYQGFYQILGDNGQATEAAQLLSQLAKNEEDVANWINIAAGVYGTFGESLPIESLMEAVNETAKTAEVTGTLSDALNWVGRDAEIVEEQLQYLGDETSRAQYLMWLLSSEYDNAAESFYQNNEAIIAARDAQAELDASTAVLGESVANLKTTLWEAFGPTLVGLIDGVASAFERLQPLIELISSAIGWLIDRVTDVLGLINDLFTVEKKLDVSKVPAGLFGDSGGAITWSATRSSSSGAYSGVPAFANGGLVPPNDPFLAVLGDNTREAEVVAPYSTIKHAAGEAIAENGGNGGVSRVEIVVRAKDGFTRNLSYSLSEESRRRGVRLVNG